MTFRILLLLLFCTTSALGIQISPLPLRDSVDLLINVGESKLGSDLPGAIRILTRAVNHARIEVYEKGLARSLQVRGSAEGRSQNAENALRDFKEAAEIYEKLGDDIGQGLCVNGMATAHQKLEHFPESLHYANIAEKLLASDSVKLGRVLNVKGVLYLQIKEYDKALANFKRSYNLFKGEASPGWLCSALNNIALCYEYKKNYDESIKYYEKSLSLAREINDPTFLTLGLSNLGNIYLNTERYDSAKILFLESADIGRKNNVYIHYSRALINLSQVSQQLNDINESEKYALEGLKVIEDNHITTMRQVAYERLSEIYRKKGKTEMAVKYEQKNNDLKDSLLTEERRSIGSLTTIQSKQTRISRGFTAPWMIALFALIITTPLVIVLVKRKRKVQVESEIEIKIKEPQGQEELQSIEVINGGGLKLLSLDELVFIEREEKSYYASANNQRYRIGQSVSHIEPMLPKNFFRINRQVIINTRFMHNYSFWENHKYVLRMNDDNETEFTIARSRLRELKKLF